MALDLPLQGWQWFKQKTTWRTRPLAQNLIAGLVLCLLPGIYLALTSLGAGGGRSSSETLASNVNAILYGVFAGTGWLGGIVMNLLGPKLTIASSAIGYIAYTAGLSYFDTSGKSWLAYMGGALEGVCAGLLWASAGAIAYSYAEERRKAFYVTIQWVCCVGGSTIAAIIALGIDLHSRDESAGAPTSAYGVLISLQASSIAISLLLLVRPSEVQRSDGLRIANSFNSSAIDELCSTWELVKEWRFILLLPAMFSGEVTLAQQSSLNARYFDLRTRSLNNILFNSVQIPASLGITWILDRSRLSSRKHRSLVAISIVTVFIVSVCSGQIAWLLQHRIDRKGQGSLTDWKDSAFGGAFAIYILYGAVYGAFQMTTQYLLSSFTNEPLKLARYSGLFRGVNALGMMTAFLIDGYGVSYFHQIIFQFACFVLGLASLFVVASKYVTSTNYGNEDNVVAPQHVQDTLCPSISLENMPRPNNVDTSRRLNVRV